MHLYDFIDENRRFHALTNRQGYAFIRRCLILILLGATMLASHLTYAVERQPLIQLADRGLFYFLHTALNDASFVTELKPEEKKMADQLSLLLEFVSDLRWFNENKVQFYKKRVKENDVFYDIFLFAYVDGNENVASYDSLYKEAPRLTFSNEREKFLGLKPGEGERAAKTTKDFISPIEFNLHRLNSTVDEEFKKFDIGKAVALLTHEYGHKLGPKEDLEACYSLGVKLGDFVKGRVNEHPLQNGTMVYSLHWNQFEFNKWMGVPQFPEAPAGMQIIFGAVGGEPSFSRGRAGLPIFANQGLYVWAESDNTYADLTTSVLKQLNKDKLLNWARPEEDYYQFLRHKMYAIQSFRIEEPQPGQIEMKSSFAQVEVIFPFMVPEKSKPPKEIEFNKRYFWSVGRHIMQPQVKSISYRYSGPFFQFESLSEKSFQIIDMPQYKSQMLSSERQGDDLIVRIKIEGQKIISYNERTGLAGLGQAEIGIKSKQGHILFTSESFDPTTDVFTFRIPRASDILKDKLEIDQFFLRVTNSKIIDETFFLKAEVPLFEKIVIPLEILEEKKPQVQEVKELISIEVQSEKMNIDVRSKGPLRSIGLKIKMMKSTFSAVHAFDENEILDRKQTDNVTSEYFLEIVVDAKDFKQSSKGDLVTLEYDLKKIGSLLSVQELGRNDRQSEAQMSQSMVTIIHPEMSVLQVSFVDSAFEHHVVKPKGPFVFEAKSSNPQYEKYKMLLNAKLFENFVTKTCQSLF